MKLLSRMEISRTAEVVAEVQVVLIPRRCGKKTKENLMKMVITRICLVIIAVCSLSQVTKAQTGKGSRVGISTLYDALRQASKAENKREMERLKQTIEAHLKAKADLQEAREELSEILVEFSLVDVAEHELGLLKTDSEHFSNTGLSIAAKLFKDIEWHIERAKSMRSSAHGPGIDYADVAAKALASNPDPEVRNSLVLTRFQRYSDIVSEQKISYSYKKRDYEMLARALTGD